MAQSNTFFTHTSPLESVLRPANVYPGKRRLMPKCAIFLDHRMNMFMPHQISPTVPGCQDTLSKESSLNHTASAP
ncbi:hypothetical protein YQE_02405, partial [Dendroctonus ponderosae]